VSDDLLASVMRGLDPRIHHSSQRLFKGWNAAGQPRRRVNVRSNILCYGGRRADVMLELFFVICAFVSERREKAHCPFRVHQFLGFQAMTGYATVPSAAANELK
jgi:hypothetical protein